MAKDARPDDPFTKILDIEQLREALARRTGCRVVHCHGVFDLLHVGHIRHLRQAAQMGDVLVVTLTPDRHVNKGPDRPVFTERLRAEAIAALGFVDYVAINRWPTAVETIRLLQPNLYVKGPDYNDARRDVTGAISEEEAAVREVGGRLVLTEDITFSSSALINRHLPTVPPEVRAYLDGFRRRFAPGSLGELLDHARRLKVLVVGEAILDEYQYCETMGKSGKEPVLAARQLSTERFAGGSLAVANHVAGFAGEVELITVLGPEPEAEAFVRAHLKPNVKATLLRRAEAPTIVKRRFVEVHNLQKLFETYVMDDRPLTAPEEEALCVALAQALPRHDAVIAIDFGHSLLEGAAVAMLAKESPFLAVNTQTNAGNRGFNTISKYPRAHFVSLAQHELALETRERWRDLREQMETARARVPCDTMMVTRGRHGSVTWTSRDGCVEVPAFTRHVIDRVGAGDAVFSVTSLAAVQGAPAELIGFLGSATGSMAVNIVGNRESIERVPLLKYVETLLK